MYSCFIGFKLDDIELVNRIFEVIGFKLLLDLRTDLGNRRFGVNQAHEAIIVLFV
ncbi:hypothetical protein D3C80_2051010 [compost metagenome]